MNTRLTQVQLGDPEKVFSLDVKSLWTNVLITEAIVIAINALYLSDKLPEFDRETCCELLELALANAHFMCGDKRCVQKDGVAMSAAKAVIVANLWIKQFEEFLASEDTGTEWRRNCDEKATRRGYSVRCNSLQFWFHRRCSGIPLEDIREMEYSDWKGHSYLSPPTTSGMHAKVFGRYLDDVIRTTASDKLTAYCRKSTPCISPWS